MAYELPTKNHGKIEAGYFSVFTQEVRMGDFSIPTNRFCKFVAELATGKEAVRVPTTEGSQVNGSWDPTQKIVRLGQYEISGDEFGVFADYVFNGGFMGWKPDQPEWRPDFVKSAVDYVRQNMGEQPAGSYLSQVQQKQLPRLEERL